MTAVAARYLVRVMVLDAWDHVTVQVGPDTTVAELKREALARARGVAGAVEEYEVKFRGARVLDEQTTLAALGAGANAASAASNATIAAGRLPSVRPPSCRTRTQRRYAATTTDTTAPNSSGTCDG